MVSPAEFIPLAEDTGLIEAIGEWVLDADLPPGARLARPRARARGRRQRLAARAGEPGLRPPRSPTACARTALGPGELVIEIIESALSEPAAVAPVLERISELGVRVAIDDFGAGFSSLTRLRHLTVHILKLDRSFLAGVPEDARGGAFIAAMLRLARELDLYVVAEGIETAAQLEFLRAAPARRTARASISRGRCRPPS